jgi:ketosteroid isomerase-like protein
MAIDFACWRRWPTTLGPGSATKSPETRRASRKPPPFAQRIGQTLGLEPSELRWLAGSDQGAAMGARTPEQIDELMLVAYESRDAEAIADLYEDDAIYANPANGWTVVGRAAIIEKLHEMFSMTSSIGWICSPPARFVVAGDYAFSHFTSVNQALLTDGTPYESEGRTTTVAHRAGDGNWRYVIDHVSTL